MIDLSNKTCVVLDHGMFLELALRLARDFGHVYYVDPLWEESFAKLNHALIGDGFDEIERVKEIWDVIDQVDLAVFPDTFNSAMQEYIAQSGIPVWGGRRADSLELKKIAFRRMQKSMGLNIPDYDVVTGLDRLRDYCKSPEHENRWIKLSPQFRGHQETFRHVTYDQTRLILDEMGIEFGPIQDSLTFLCEKSIDSKLEGGLDTYTVDGQHPDIAVLGYEAKDQCYFAAVRPYDKIAPEITSVHEPLWPVLKGFKCRQFISSETKITESGESYLLEPTIRLPSPAGEEQMELYGNLSEIIYEGANGRLVQPELTAKYACEAMIEYKGKLDRWRSLQVPDSVRKWIKLYNTVKVGDRLAIIPGTECLGAVVGIGDTPQEALDHLKENAAAIEDQPVVVHVESLATILDEIQASESAGIEFSKEEIPEPSEVLEK